MYAKEEGLAGVGLLFAHRCRSHSRIISGRLLDSQWQPRVTQRRVPYKGLSLFLTPIESIFPLLSREWSGQPHTWLTGWLSSPPIRVSSHPAWVSRQNVSLAVVLERRALNFKFSYTFPLNGMRRQRRRKRERKERKKAWEMVSVEG